MKKTTSRHTHSGPDTDIVDALGRHVTIRTCKCGAHIFWPLSGPVGNPDWIEAPLRHVYANARPPTNRGPQGAGDILR